MSAVGHEEPRINDPAPRGVLAAARLAQNLSIAEVAEQLKLSERQVEALEAGAYDKLPGPVFVRGFIRNYARLLNLDPDRVLASVNADLPVSAAHHETPHSVDIPFPSPVMRRWPKYAITGSAVLAGLVAYEFYWGEPPTVTVVRPIAPPVAPMPVVAPAALNAVPDGASSEQPAAQPSPETPEAAPPADMPQPEAQPKRAEGELHLRFERDSWVEIRDGDGRIVFTRLNPAGTERRVSGKPPFKLIVGNARGVRLTYNERPLDLGRYVLKDDVARFTLE